MIRIRTALIVIGYLLAVASVWAFVFVSLAKAEPPPGTDLNTPEHLWWESQHARSGGSCCGSADGFVLNDDEWRIHDGGYQVHLDNQWVEVPYEAMSQPNGTEPNSENRWRAKVWIAPGTTRIYCFQAGAGL